MSQQDLPVLPYAGTSGHSGSETSAARANYEDANGITSLRQRLTIDALYLAKVHGLTWKELGEAMGWHHGQASGCLSALHKERYIARLTASRNGCRVYVHPDHVAGRKVEAYKANKKKQPGTLSINLPKELIEWIAGTEDHEVIHFGPTTSALLRQITRETMKEQA
jgi:hypothetical protein